MVIARNLLRALEANTGALPLIERAIDYLETHETQIECAYFVAYNEAALQMLKAAFGSIPDLAAPITLAGSR